MNLIRTLCFGKIMLLKSLALFRQNVCMSILAHELILYYTLRVVSLFINNFGTHTCNFNKLLDYKFSTFKAKLTQT